MALPLRTCVSSNNRTMFKYGCACRSRCRHRPRWNLERLRRLAKHHDTAFVGLPRARVPTAHALGISLDAAGQYALSTVQLLRDQDFVEAVQLSDDWFDVYSCYREGRGWYVKLNEGDEGVVVISHHEPERPLTTIAGRVIRPVEPPQ